MTANIETGRQSLPVHKVLALAAVLGVDAWWLMAGDGAPPVARNAVQRHLGERVARAELDERLTRIEREIAEIRSLAGS